MIDRFSEEFRSTHLGASQVASAIGASPFERPIDLWQKYRGLRSWDDFDDETRERLEAGQELEDGIARMVARRLGVEIERAPMQEHPRIPWLVASRDRVIPSLRFAPLEIKLVGWNTPLYGNARDRWGEPGGDGAPLHVIAQLQTQIGVARARADNPDEAPDHGYVGAAIAGEGLRIYRVPYREGIARSIASQAAKFWEHVVNVEAGPPPADGSDAYTEWLERRIVTHPRQQRWLEGEMADELGPEVQAAYAQSKAAEERYELVKQQAMIAIGDAEGIKGPWGSVQLGRRAGKVGLREGVLRETLAKRFFQNIDPNATPEAAQQLAIDAADALIQSCKREGDPFTVFGPPRGPPKGKKR